MSTHMRDAQPAFIFVIFFQCEKKMLFRPRGGPSWSKRGTDWYHNSASKAEAHLREWEAPAWNSPTDLR